MNDSTKKKTKKVFKSSHKVVGSVGVVETASQLDDELAEKQDFWKDSIQSLKDEVFLDIDAAIERVVELTSEKIGVLPGEADTKAFMKESLLTNDEVIEILRSSLQFRS